MNKAEVMGACGRRDLARLLSTTRTSPRRIKRRGAESAEQSFYSSAPPRNYAGDVDHFVPPMAPVTLTFSVAN